jgi:hypothetical protein
MKFRRPSPAMIIACVALFAALTGGAYAAKKLTKLPKNIVSAKSIKNGAVTTPKIKNAAVTQAKLAPGAGSTAAYARITNDPALTDSTPVVDAANSKNVTAAATTTKDKGIVCIDASIPVKSISANAEDSGSGQAIVAETLLSPPATVGCPSTTDAVVRTKNAATGADINSDFYVTLFQ